jgi:hypothetical protein
MESKLWAGTNKKICGSKINFKLNMKGILVVSRVARYHPRALSYPLLQLSPYPNAGALTLLLNARARDGVPARVR